MRVAGLPTIFTQRIARFVLPVNSRKTVSPDHATAPVQESERMVTSGRNGLKVKLVKCETSN